MGSSPVLHDHTPAGFIATAAVALLSAAHGGGLGLDDGLDARSSAARHFGRIWEVGVRGRVIVLGEETEA